ncbi:GTP-binding protein [Candidatus Profftella armatura]
MNLEAPEKKQSVFKKHSLLRFITAGSVDDGKSTLIGRLLFDSKNIFIDQLDAVSRTKYKRVMSGHNIDLSLLTDGLESEREQGITIDVAYRYFNTPKRKFIIADTPGHEQYTRNMITGASTADAVIILIDASKIKFNPSVNLLTQTKRHSIIAHLLRIKHIIIAVNKMEIINYNQIFYKRIVYDYKKFAEDIHFQNINTIPISALNGDNIISASNNMLWYNGPTLISLLESLNTNEKIDKKPLRFPVQLVARHCGHISKDFRSYMGRIESGIIKKNDCLIVEPSGKKATIKDIQMLNKSLDMAITGQSVTLIIKEYLDISRGNMLVSPFKRPVLLRSINANLCWLSEESLDLRRKYLLKHSTNQILSRILKINALLNINTQKWCPPKLLDLNDIGCVTINIYEPISVDSYDNIRSTGSFILIDEITFQTVAAGMIIL